MAVKLAREWFSRLIGLQGRGSSGDEGIITIAHRVVLDIASRISTSFDRLTEAPDPLATLHFLEFAKYLARKGHMLEAEHLMRPVMERFIAVLPVEQRELLLRCAVSMEVLRRLSEGRVGDILLVSWLRRILPKLEGCEQFSLRCLLEELTADPGRIGGVVYGLARLQDMAFREGTVDFFDYSVITLSLAGMDRSTAKRLAEMLSGSFDSSNIFASELAYHVYWLLVFNHGVLPEKHREVLELAQYSPNSIVACRSNQLLEKELDPEKIDKWSTKPCLVLARYQGREDLYIIE